MQSQYTTQKDISLSHESEQDGSVQYERRGAFEVFAERDWQSTLEKCNTHFFTQETLLGHMAKKVFHCGFIVCEKEDCIKSRINKFMKSHEYLHNGNVQIKVLKVNNMRSVNGINKAFRDLEEYNKYYGERKQAYTIFLGKTRLWIAYRTEKDVFQSRKEWYFERLLKDYVNLSGLGEEATNELMDRPGRKRIRTHNMKEKREKITKQPKFACTKIDEDYIMLLKKKRFRELKKHEKIGEILYKNLNEIKFLTYNGKAIWYNELMNDPERYWQEIASYFGKKHQNFCII